MPAAIGSQASPVPSRYGFLNAVKFNIVLAAVFDISAFITVDATTKPEVAFTEGARDKDTAVVTTRMNMDRAMICTLSSSQANKAP